MMECIKVPQAVLNLMKQFRNAGFEAYAVGGCVRDSLLGREPHDWDLTTNAMPDEIQSVFHDYRTIDTGIRYGTVSVLTDIGAVEITTYRTEAGYADGRHPDSVAFVRNLEEDLKRRDFTVNAMAYSPWEGVIDLHGGREDLKNNILRCVGAPSVRFEEDALRIMRALRFSSVYCFSIETETAAAIHKLANHLNVVAVERIAIELAKFLEGADAPRLIDEFFDVFTVFMPELTPMRSFNQYNPHHDSDVLTHTLRAVEAVPNDASLRLAALLHDAGKPAVFSMDENGVGHFYTHENESVNIAEAIMNRLKLDNKTQTRVLQLIKYHGVQIAPEEKAVKRWLNRIGEETFKQLLYLKRADVIGQAPAYQEERLEQLEMLEKICDNILAQGACFSVSDLAVGGKDLIQAGMQEGKAIGNALNILLEAVMDGKVENEQEALLRYIFS